MKRYLLFVLIVHLIYACTPEDCDFDRFEYNLIDNTNHSSEPIGKVEVKGCDEIPLPTYEKGFVGRLYFKEIALEKGFEPYYMFEKGEEQIDNLLIIEQHADHIIELFNPVTLVNNINNPYAFEVSPFETTGEEGNILKQGTANVVIDGHPLQMILALADANDQGGAKKWVYKSGIDANTNEEIDIKADQWSCFFDNNYTFMKGNRFKYDPNETGCQKELEKFPNQTPQIVYGKYEITNEENPKIVLSITAGLENAFVETLIVEEWSVDNWDEIKVRGTFDGKEVIATMMKETAVDWDNF